MKSDVIDAGVVLAFLEGRHRSWGRIERLFFQSKSERKRTFLSVVNLAEILRSVSDLKSAAKVDPAAILRSWNIRIHPPDEAVARRAAELGASLGGSIAAATALELGARLHTTDGQLVELLKGNRLAMTLY